MERSLQFRKTLSTYAFMWIGMTAICIVFSTISSSTNPFIFLLVGSLLSIFGSTILLISGALASSEHKNKYSLVYSLVMCTFVLSLKLLLTAAVVISLHEKWQHTHIIWCYCMALLGHFSMIGILGYSFVMILDTMILPSDSYSGRQVIYHVTIWLLATFSSLPPLAAGAVGVAEHGVCNFIGAYELIPGITRAVFQIFCFVFIAYVLCSYACCPNNLKLSEARACHCLLIFISVFFSIVWNVIFYMVRNVTGRQPSRWLYIVQLFWLGGAGFSNALVWYPFIKRALRQVSVNRSHSNLTGEDGENVPRNLPIAPPLPHWHGRRVDYDENAGAVLDMPVYRIPKRWQQETVNPYI